MKEESAPVVSRGDGDGSCSQASSPAKLPLYDTATRRRPEGRKASAAAPFVLDAAAAQELLDAAAARKQVGQVTPAQKQAGQAAPAATKTKGLQRTGTALGLKRKAAAAAVAPSEVTSFSSAAVSSPTTPPWMRSQASDPAAWTTAHIPLVDSCGQWG